MLRASFPASLVTNPSVSSQAIPAFSYLAELIEFRNKHFGPKSKARHTDTRPHIEEAYREGIAELSARTSIVQERAKQRLRECRDSEQVDNDLLDRTVKAVELGLRASLQYAEVVLQDLFDPHITEEDKRLAAYADIKSALDFTCDSLQKIRTRPEFEGTLSLSQDREYFFSIKACEEMQRSLRAAVIDRLVIARRTFATQHDIESEIVLSPPARNTHLDRIDITARIVLESIRDVNPRPEHHENPQSVSGGTINVDLKGEQASNRYYNCTRVVPATLATLLGGKARAMPALDDQNVDMSMRFMWKTSYEEVYGGSFEPLDSLQHLFGRLQHSPVSELGIIQYGNPGHTSGHVAVSGKIGGIVCVIDAQDASIVTEDSPGQFRRRVLMPNGEIENYPYDPGRMHHPHYLHVERDIERTEFERGREVTEALHRLLPDLRLISLHDRPVGPMPPAEGPPPPALSLT